MRSSGRSILGTLILTSLVAAVVALPRQAAAVQPLDVFVGYADDLRPSPFFPNPWSGSPNILFIGSGSPFDAGAIRIDNLSGAPLAIDNVTVDLQRPGPVFNLWGSFVIPTGFSAILTQTSQFNFDTTDYPFLAPCDPPAPFGTGPLGKITITIGGVPESYLDNAHVLDTGGADIAGCNNQNESLQWRLIGTCGVDCPGGDPCAQDLTPPQFTAPACGAVDSVYAGSSIAIPVSAFDPDSGQSVTLAASLPAGATFSTSPGNPATGTINWTPTAGDRGCHEIILSATDTCHTDTCRVTVCVLNRPPNCSAAVASEGVLWPPNHSYHAISVLGVTDPDGDPVAITVTGITQDEPVNGRGDGNTCPDAQVVGGQASVRAERTGTPGVPGNGRVYAISFTAVDGVGGECSGVVYACVPHDQSNPTCTDDGQRYNSLGDCRSNREVAPEAMSLTVARVSGSQAELNFALPVDAVVNVSVYDVLGHRVAMIENGMLASGVYTRVWNMDNVAKGIYFVRLRTETATLTERVLKIR